MTSQTRVTNTALFEDGDVPSGTNYRDLIDSYLSLIDTTAQAITSNITIPTLTVVTVSAGTIYTDEMNFNVETTAAVSAAASVAGYIIVKVSGVDKRIAYYNAEQ